MYPSLGALRARIPEQASARRALAARARRVLALVEENAVSVNEIACADPGCPDAETVILLMPAGRPTRVLRIAKPIAAVTDADIAAGGKAEAADHR